MAKLGQIKRMIVACSAHFQPLILQIFQKSRLFDLIQFSEAQLSILVRTPNIALSANRCRQDVICAHCQMFDLYLSFHMLMHYGNLNWRLDRLSFLSFHDDVD